MASNKVSTFSVWMAILIWGGLWGIFESTVGYLLHLLPISIGWIVWYPVACFFMMNVYRKTQRASAIVMVGTLSACIKLINLFLPGRIDRVINPAISILFEAIAMAAAVYIVNNLLANKKRTPLYGDSIGLAPSAIKRSILSPSSLLTASNSFFCLASFFSRLSIVLLLMMPC